MGTVRLSVVQRKKLPDVGGELGRHLQRRKVPPAREHRPLLDIVHAGSPAAGRPVDLGGEDRRSRGHLCNFPCHQQKPWHVSTGRQCRLESCQRPQQHMGTSKNRDTTCPAYILTQSFVVRMQHDREKQFMQKTEETGKMLSERPLCKLGCNRSSQVPGCWQHLTGKGQVGLACKPRSPIPLPFQRGCAPCSTLH